MGVAQSAGSLSRILGPAIAGPLFELWGRNAPLFVGARASWLAGGGAGGAAAARAARGAARSSALMSGERIAAPMLGTALRGRLLRQELKALARARALSLAARLARAAGAGASLALVLLVAAKRVNVDVPLLYKRAVDALTAGPCGGRSRAGGADRRPMALARVGAQVFDELRDAVFAKVEQRAVRHVALATFRHLHALSLRFHLERQTGGLARAIERGTAASSSCSRSCCSTSCRRCSRSCWSAASCGGFYDGGFAAVDAGRRSSATSPSPSRHRLADQLPPRDERARQRGQHQGDRQPAQLRDGQIFRQRGARGASATTARCAPMSAPRSRARRRSSVLNIGQGVDHRRRPRRGDAARRARASPRAA